MSWLFCLQDIWPSLCNSVCSRIGLAIARDLGKNGSKVVISSRKQEHVSTAIKQLEDEGLDVRGTVCHVGKAKDRAHLIDFVSWQLFSSVNDGGD